VVGSQPSGIPGAPLSVLTVPGVVDDAQYEFTSVQTIRGGEAKTIAKWKTDGWELDSRDQGLLRTEMTFRRVKPTTLGSRILAAFGRLEPTMQRTLVAASAAVVVLLVAVGVVVGMQGGGGGSQPTASATEAAAASTAPSAEIQAPAEPVRTTPAAEEILTVENNAQLAALLASTSPSVAEVGAFASQYAGQTIEFDGNIAFMNDHGGFSTRYDLLILAGDFSTTTSSGPSFQFRDVNLTSDLKLVGPNIPDTVGKGDNLRITARVGDYNSTQELLFLEPVSIALRETAPVARQAAAPQPSQAVTLPAPAAPEPAAAAPQAPASTYYANCAAARAAGAAPVRAGDPGYGSHLDRDGDGVGCE